MEGPATAWHRSAAALIPPEPSSTLRCHQKFMERRGAGKDCMKLGYKHDVKHCPW